MAGYIGVTGKARRIKSAYVGVDNVARNVLKGYVGINNKAYEFILNPAAEMFGNGSDGDITFSTSKTLTVNDTARNMVRISAKNLTINSGVTIKIPRCNGAIIMCTGDLVIHGTLTADKSSPFRNLQEDAALAEPHIAILPAEAVCGDGSDAGPGRAYEDGLVGASGAGGDGFKLGGGWGGGSGGVVDPVDTDYGDKASPGISGQDRDSISGAGGGIIKKEWDFGRDVVHSGGMTPGSSGAVFHFDKEDETGRQDFRHTDGNSGDAYGGGTIILAVRGNVLVDGHVYARGGNGAAPKVVEFVFTYRYSAVYSGGGGAGGGGMVVLITSDDSTYIVDQASVDVSGGTGGSDLYYEEADADDGEPGFTHHYTLSDLYS